MKVAITCWIAPAIFAWLVAGKAFEQAILVSQIVFVGWILGYIAGRVSNFIANRNRSTSMTRNLRRKK